MGTNDLKLIGILYWLLIQLLNLSYMRFSYDSSSFALASLKHCGYRDSTYLAKAFCSLIIINDKLTVVRDILYESLYDNGGFIRHVNRI